MGTIANCKKEYANITPMNRCFIITRSQLTEISNKLNNTSFLAQLSNAFTDFASYIISIKSYPIDLNAMFATQASPIQCNSQTLVSDAKQIILGQNPNANFDEVKINMGTFQIDEQFHNFLDYAPYTKVQLWLPYGQYVDLDLNLIMGKLCKITYVLSIVTGEATAFITANDDLIMTSDIKLDFNVPFNNVNYIDVNKGYISNAIGAVGGAVSTAMGVASGNAVATVGGVMKLANIAGATIVNSTQPRIEKGKITTEVGGLFGSQIPYLVISRPRALSDTNYIQFKGKPCGRMLTLNQLSGYTQIEDIHLENFGDATQSEIDSIESLLKAGVIL